jgi:hypothetical protein
MVASSIAERVIALFSACQPFSLRCGRLLVVAATFLVAPTFFFAAVMYFAL